MLTDLATYGMLNSELMNCPRTAAVLGELAAQWQQMMGTLQRVEQEAVSSQSLANANENIGRTRTDATGSGRLRLKDLRTTLPKELVRQHTNWRLCTVEDAAWLGFIDLAHRGWKANSADHRGRSEGRELTVDMLKSDNACRAGLRACCGLGQRDRRRSKSYVLRITQTEPSLGFVAWHALGDGYAPKSSNEPAKALQPVLATPKRCKDAKELKEMASSDGHVKVAEYEHQFKDD